MWTTPRERKIERVLTSSIIVVKRGPAPLLTIVVGVLGLEERGDDKAHDQGSHPKIDQFH